MKKGGTLSADGRDRVLLALEQLDVPPPPRRIADRMPGSCAKIKHTFVWTRDGVH